MIQATAAAKKAILRALRKRSMRPAQLFDRLCPPPEFSTEQIQDSLAILIDERKVEFTPGRKLKVKK